MSHPRSRPFRYAAPGGTREVATLAWPAVVNMMSFTLMGTADTYFVGKLGTVEQGAVGFCGTLLWTVMCFFVGTLEIVQTYVAQSVGAGDPRRAARWGETGYWLALVFSVLPLPLAFLGHGLFGLFGIAPEMIPFADAFFRIRILGAVFFLLSRVGDVYFRGSGDTVTPMVVTILANIVNVALNPVLIFGVEPLGIPAMGVEGSAWATVIGTIVHVGLYWEIQRRGRRAGRAMPSWRARWAPEDAKEVLRVGSPSGLHWLLDVGAWTLFTVVVARLDPVQSAANIIGITLIRVSFMPGYGISTAAQTLVGQYLGARDPKSAARSGWTSVGITCAYMCGVGFCLWLFRVQLVGLFSDDPQVVEVGARLMIWAALFQLGDGVQVVLAGALRGAGDTKYVMIASLTGAWLVFAPLTFYLMMAHGLGAEGGWIAVNAWVIALAVLLVVRFRGDAWTKGGINLEPRPVPEAEVA